MKLKKVSFITVLITIVMVMVLQADFPGIYDFQWKTYKQTQSSYCCGCSDSNKVYFVVTFEFGEDGKIYDRHGQTQIGTWNYDGPLDGRVYFSPAINGVSYFNFTHTDGSVMLIGGNDTLNTWCVRGNPIQ